MGDTARKIDNGQGVRWRAAEFEHVERGPSWYWAISILAALLSLFALWQKSFFFLLFIILGVGLVFVFGKRRPRVYDFAVTEESVKIGSDIKYRYDQLAGFDLRDRPGRLDEIVLKRARAAHPYVKLPIDSQTAEDAIALLSVHLPRFQYQETILDLVSDFLGF